MREGFQRSVHFPAAAPEQNKPAEPKTPEPSALELYAETLRDTEIIRERLRGLLATQSRHGDLQAALSAARRLAEKLQSLIEHEERS